MGWLGGMGGVGGMGGEGCLSFCPSDGSQTRLGTFFSFFLSFFLGLHVTPSGILPFSVSFFLSGWISGVRLVGWFLSFFLDLPSIICLNTKLLFLKYQIICV